MCHNRNKSWKTLIHLRPTLVKFYWIIRVYWRERKRGNISFFFFFIIFFFWKTLKERMQERKKERRERKRKREPAPDVLEYWLLIKCCWGTITGPYIEALACCCCCCWSKEWRRLKKIEREREREKEEREREKMDEGRDGGMVERKGEHKIARI